MEALFLFLFVYNVAVIIVLFDSSLLIHLIHLSSFIIFLSPPSPSPSSPLLLSLLPASYFCN